MSEPSNPPEAAYGTELHPYVPASWFHPEGIHKVLKKLSPRLPDVSGKLFLTFTLDPSLFRSSEEAFEKGRAKLRKVFYELRNGVVWEGREYKIDAPYGIKVEFHENGWAHFHAIFLTHRFLPGPLLTGMWGLGRTDVRRIDSKEFRYLLKYVTKEGDLPDWILNRKRLRVFQSSKGFLKPAKDAEDSSAAEKTADREPERRRRRRFTIGERLERWGRLAVIRNGILNRIVEFERPYQGFARENAIRFAKTGRYLGRGGFAIDGLLRREVFGREKVEFNWPGFF
jgi:hypothetical protein